MLGSEAETSRVLVLWFSLLATGKQGHRHVEMCEKWTTAPRLGTSKKVREYVAAWGEGLNTVPGYSLPVPSIDVGHLFNHSICS